VDCARGLHSVDGHPAPGTRPQLQDRKVGLASHPQPRAHLNTTPDRIQPKGAHRRRPRLQRHLPTQRSHGDVHPSSRIRQPPCQCPAPGLVAQRLKEIGLRRWCSRNRRLNAAQTRAPFLNTMQPYRAASSCNDVAYAGSRSSRHRLQNRTGADGLALSCRARRAEICGRGTWHVESRGSETEASSACAAP
jgi:hypothetical protein